MSDEEEKKWKLGVSINYKDQQLNPELKITDNIDDNQKLSFKLGKESIYADYELKF